MVRNQVFTIAKNETLSQKREYVIIYENNWTRFQEDNKYIYAYLKQIKQFHKKATNLLIYDEYSQNSSQKVMNAFIQAPRNKENGNTIFKFDARASRLTTGTDACGMCIQSRFRSACKSVYISKDQKTVEMKIRTSYHAYRPSKHLLNCL